MRTDLYERAPGQNYVYVKFRCRRCKRLGQTFVPEARWDWSLLEPSRDELSEPERNLLLQAGPISDAELLDFHLRLKNLDDFTGLHVDTSVDTQSASESPEQPAEAAQADEPNETPDLKPGESHTESRSEELPDRRRSINGKNSSELNGATGEKQADDCGNNV